MDKNLTKTPAKNKIYFFGYPQHGNLGDHAIALAIIDRLKKHFPDNEIITVPVDEGVKDILTTEKYTSDIKPEDLIVITGGGNMGNQYIGEEYLRQLVIRSFPKNKIISFPQTIHFVDNGCNYVKYYNDYLKNTYGVSTDWLENTSKQYMIDCFKSVYESHPNLYIFAREKYSYDILKNLLPSSNVYMTPDIVLQNIKKQGKKNRNGVGICLRQDLETKLKDKEKQALINALNKDNEIITFDTVLKGTFTQEKGKSELNKLLNKISKCEVLVTDRLHGLIFAVITGTPCVVMGNYNHKISGTYELIKDCKNIVFVKDSKNVAKLVNQLKTSDSATNFADTLLPLFSPLDEVLDKLKKDEKPSEKAMLNPKFSICVPVYNVEKYLEKCLNSIINQTYKNIEIICVEDGSTDKSAKILNKIAKKDSRIKVIKHNSNKGLLAGRQTAVSCATGNYIMFVDSDDTIELDACEILAKHIEEKAPDILSFDCNVINLGKDNEQIYNDAIIRFKPKLKNGEILYKEEISTNCYINEKFTFNIWNKIYKADLCRRAYSILPDKKIVWAEDLFASQYLFYYAKNMLHIDKKLYNYAFGTGVSTTIKDYEKFINNFFNDLEYISHFQNFLIKTGQKESLCYKSAEYKKAKTIQTILLLSFQKTDKDAMLSFFNKLIDTYGLQMIDTILQACIEQVNEKSPYYTPAFEQKAYTAQAILPILVQKSSNDVLIKALNSFFEIHDLRLVEYIFKTCFADYNKIANVLPELYIFKQKTKKPKNIGIFYHRIGNGGVERVIQKITPLLLDAGYKVTLFIEEQSKHDYDIDKRANIELIPLINENNPNDCTMLRCYVWKDLIEKNNIDTIMYQASSYHYMIYDMMFCKLMGLNFITTAHEFFSQGMCYHNPFLKKRMATIKGVDFLQTLSKTEEVFWRNLGVNAKYIPNPLTFNPANNKIAPKQNKTIVWVGRFDPCQKKPKDAIDIMKVIHKQNKDVKMIMLGKGENDFITQEIRDYIKHSGLEGVVENIYDNDIKKYYEKSSLLLSTSVYESFSLVLAEAMSFGLPCVIYNMPYLELVRNNLGVISVDQRDINVAAQTILNLLDNQALLEEKGLCAKKFIDEFAKVDPLTEWKNVFKEIQTNSKPKIENIYNQIIGDVVFEHFTVGMKELEGRIFQPYNTKLSFFARAKRCLKVNGVWGTFKKVVKKSLGKAKRILKKILCKNKNTSK